MKGYETITIPPPFGSGNLKRMKRPLMHDSTAGLFIVEDFLTAEETVPSLAMTNFTTIFPPSFGFFVSSRE